MIFFNTFAYQFFRQCFMSFQVWSAVFRFEFICIHFVNQLNNVFHSIKITTFMNNNLLARQFSTKFDLSMFYGKLCKFNAQVENFKYLFIWHASTNWTLKTDILKPCDFWKQSASNFFLSSTPIQAQLKNSFKV